MNNNILKNIDIIIPIYNEEENIPLLISRLDNVIQQRLDIVFTYIFINDGSIDHSLQLLKDYSKNNNHIKILNFSRNFGHQAAVTAGIDISNAEATVLIDADLQDPPEIILDLILELESGYDVIYAQRKSRKGESWHKKLTAKLFYLLFDKLTNLNIPRDTGDFRIMRKCVVHELQNMREHHRFIRGMVAWCGFRTKAFLYHRDARHAGETGYSYKKMITFSLNAFFSFSSAPIKLVNYIGMIAVILGFLGLGRLTILWLILDKYDKYEAGLITTLIAILFIGGIQLISIGVLGEYIGRTFEQSKMRPLYIISEKINFEENIDPSNKII